MKSTRERILRCLLAFTKPRINDLADLVGINPISVRHHLSALQSEVIVTSTEKRRRVGRSRLACSLAAKGAKTFSASYIKPIQRLLGKFRGKYSDRELNQIFQAIGEDIASDQLDTTQNLPLSQKNSRTSIAINSRGIHRGANRIQQLLFANNAIMPLLPDWDETSTNMLSGSCFDLKIFRKTFKNPNVYSSWRTTLFISNSEIFRRRCL